MGSLIKKYNLPWPPTINHYYRRGGRGMFITAAGRNFRTRVKALVKREAPFEGPLEVTVLLYPPDKRRRDIDNVLKALQDALQNAGVYVDDCQIQTLHVFKKEVQKPNGLAVVTVEEVNTK